MDEKQLPQNVKRIFDLMTDPDKLYFVCPYRLGDMVLVGVLVHAVLERTRKKSAALIVQNGFKGFDVSFDGVDEIKYATPGELLEFKAFVKKQNKYVGDNWIYAHYHLNAANRFIVSGGINFLDSYKRDIFDISPDTPVHAPTVKDISDENKAALCEKYVIDKERTVILAPHANLYKPLSLQFWYNLIACLKQEGCIVYTNVARKPNGRLEQPIKDTLPMNVSLNEIYWLADKVHCIIGMRSGLFDLLAFSKATIYCLGYRNYHNDLKQMYPNTPSTIRTMYTMNAHDEKALKHWGIPLENTFTDEKLLIRSLLASLGFRAGTEEFLTQLENYVPPEVQRVFDLMTDPDKLYIVCFNATGDILWTGGFAYAIRDKFKKRAAVLIMPERFRTLDVGFEGVEAIKYISYEDWFAFREWLKISRIHSTDNYIYAHFNFDAQGNEIDTHVADWNFMDRFKNSVFKLPLDTTCLPPIVTDISDEAKKRLHTDYMIDRDRTVILTPFSDSERTWSLEFQKNLVDYLNQRGFIIYTNIGIDNKGIIQPPLENTLPLYTTYNEVYYLADKVRCFIGVHSGLFDLLAFSDATIFCTSYLKFTWNLELLYPNRTARIHTFILVPGDAEGNLNVRPIFQRQIENLHIDPSIIFTSEDAFFKALTKSIETTLNLNNEPSAERIFDLMINPDRFYIVCPYRLGDMILVGILVHAVLEQFNKKSAVLIVQDSFKGFNVKFDGVDEIKYSALDDLLSFKTYVKENNKYVGDNWIYAHYHMNAAGRFIISHGLNFFETFKRNIFGLPLYAPPKAPAVKEISDDAKIRLNNNYLIDRERTVILAPHSNLYRPLTSEFWNALINHLKAEGCVVYTNIARKADGVMEQPLDGTLPLCVSLNEIYWLADKVRCIIGMRNGLLDLLAFSKAKIFCLSRRNFNNDLRLMFPDAPSEIHTLYMAGPHTSKQFRDWNIKMEDVSSRETDTFHSLIKLLDKKQTDNKSPLAKKEDISPKVAHIFDIMNDPDKVYIVTPANIGDVVIIGGLAHAVQKKFHKKTAVMIVQERIRSLEVNYDSVSEIKYVPLDELIAFRSYCKATKKYIGSNYIYGHYMFNKQGGLIYSGWINFLDRYKSDICGVPLDVPYHIPTIKDIDNATKEKFYNDYTIDKKHTVIIAPHSNSYRIREEEFWYNLVERLNSDGFMVYTNVSKKNNGEMEAPLEGTLPLCVSLNEIYWLADKVNCIIGMRSGLFDLLVFSKGTIMCISNTIHNDLKQMFPESDSILRTMYLIPDYPPENIKRWQLRPEDFFDTADDLLEELIKSIERS